MESYLPATGLGAVMPQDEFTAPVIDWTNINPFDSTEANRPREANDQFQSLEQWILEQSSTNTRPYNDQSSIDTISEPSRLLLDQNSTTETPARRTDMGKKAAAQDSSSGSYPITIEDDDTADKITAATAANNSSSNRRPASPRQQSLPVAESPEPPKKRQRRRTISGESSSGGGSTEEARAKNRLAATKCRRKKKVEERGLEERQRRLHLQRAVLREAADALANEVLALKHEILRHAACGFTPLDHYIAGAAARGSVSSASLSVSAS